MSFHGKASENVSLDPATSSPFCLAAEERDHRRFICHASLLLFPFPFGCSCSILIAPGRFFVHLARKPGRGDPVYYFFFEGKTVTQVKTNACLSSGAHVINRSARKPLKKLVIRCLTTKARTNRALGTINQLMEQKSANSSIIPIL